MLDWLFGNKEKKEEILIEPEIGSEWILTDDSPWGKPQSKPVKILDCKEGWVRYYIGDVFPDERMSLKMFLVIYKEKR